VTITVANPAIRIVNRQRQFMLVLRSRWLLPITDRPLLNGWVALERGRVAAVGRAGATLPIRDDAPLVDLGQYAVMPALTNAHVHLELSWLRGKVPRAECFTDWVPAMLQRRGAEAPDGPAIRAAIVNAIDELRAAGTGLVGDISNSLATVAPLRASALDGVVFHEVLRLASAGADAVLDAALRAQESFGTTGRFPVSLAPHAPYSVSPRLFQGIRAAQSRTPFLPSSVHVGESPEEVELLETGTGPWRTLLDRLNAWDDDWTPPGRSPVAYLDQMRVLDGRLLAVHGVQCDDADLALLQARGATLVTCPRSNQYVGVGDPPVERFYRSGVAVAVGTDSLASNDALNLFSELARMRALAPRVPAASLLESATIVGAHALGFEDRARGIEPGAPSSLIAIEIPRDIVDVEEYLVSGIAPAQVRWVDDLVTECGFAERSS
jgi:aminodeoxyfutalosine deaminase